MFSVTLTVRDALFGSTIGTRTVITRPDGSTLAQSVPAATPAVLSGMVRGLYTLKIDAAVLGGTTSILVSRNDTVQLRVITLLDAVLIGLGGALMLPAVVLARCHAHPALAAPRSRGRRR